MADVREITQNDLYAARIFFNSALPLLKVIVQDVPSIGKKFAGKSFLFQVSALYDKAEKGKMATYFDVKDGVFTTHVSEVCDKPDIELEFADLHKFITFFSGRGMPLPKLKGCIAHLGVFIALLQALLKMAGLLQATEPPKDEADQKLLVKLYFYLLANGISQLNKAGHEKTHAWTLASPDRAYSFLVDGEPELASYLRIYEGNSKAGHGPYPRCKPFLALRFDSAPHALDILMGKGDMLDYVAKEYLTIDGAPELAGVLSEYMFAVSDFAKGAYLDWPA